PSVLGRTLATARRLLATAGCRVRATRAGHATLHRARTPRIIRQAPRAGAIRLPGTPVTITLR
ncbi:MAG: hypothetical protein JWR63_3209, partial [Conexibacter sp.]|nr:hypothetical protein [Conexibacter sp.]